MWEEQIKFLMFAKFWSADTDPNIRLYNVQWHLNLMWCCSISLENFPKTFFGNCVKQYDIYGQDLLPKYAEPILILGVLLC